MVYAIETFTTVINLLPLYGSVIVTVSHFHLGIIFSGKARNLPRVEPSLSLQMQDSRGSE